MATLGIQVEVAAIDSRSPSRPLCRRCGLHPARIRSNGWREVCKSCMHENNARYYSTNRDRERKRFRQYRENHQEELSLAIAKWRSENREHLREYEKKREPHYCRPTVRKEIKIRHRQRHPFKHFSAITQQTTGSLIAPIKLWGLWKKQKGKCALTGRALDLKSRFGASLDHIVHKSTGGTTEISNLRWVCYAANVARNRFTDVEFVDLCLDVISHSFRTNGTLSGIEAKIC